jgi:hypothetical protein
MNLHKASGLFAKFGVSRDSNKSGPNKETSASGPAVAR